MGGVFPLSSYQVFDFNVRATISSTEWLVMSAGADQADAAPARSTAQTRSCSRTRRILNCGAVTLQAWKKSVNFHVEPLAEAHGQHCGIGFRVGAVVGAGLATFFMLEPHIEKYMFSTNIVRTRKLTPLGMATCRMFS